MPYLYFDMGAAVLCASFMSFGVKRRWFALGAALQLAVSTYAAYVGGYVHYGDWLKVSGRPAEDLAGVVASLGRAGVLLTAMDGPERPHTPSFQSVGAEVHGWETDLPQVTPQLPAQAEPGPRSPGFQDPLNR